MPADKSRGAQSQTDLRDRDTLGTHPADDQPRKAVNQETPHEAAQPGADVRGDLVTDDENDNQAPEGLIRKRMGPMNPTTGRKGQSD